MGYKSHGPLYEAWRKIRRNCRIGVTGASMFPEWDDDYFAYEAWCLRHGWRRGMVVARVDKTREFDPDNCVVVSRAVASGMRPCVHRLQDGRSVSDVCGTTWKRMSEDSKAWRQMYTVYKRIFRYGWDPEKAVLAPRRKSTSRLTAISSAGAGDLRDEF